MGVNDLAMSDLLSYLQSRAVHIEQGRVVSICARVVSSEVRQGEVVLLMVYDEERYFFTQSNS